jgi:hypothetical protein
VQHTFNSAANQQRNSLFIQRRFAIVVILQMLFKSERMCELETYVRGAAVYPDFVSKTQIHCGVVDLQSSL